MESRITREISRGACQAGLMSVTVAKVDIGMWFFRHRESLYWSPSLAATTAAIFGFAVPELVYQVLGNSARRRKLFTRRESTVQQGLDILVRKLSSYSTIFRYLSHYLPRCLWCLSCWTEEASRALYSVCRLQRKQWQQWQHRTYSDNPHWASEVDPRDEVYPTW